MYLKFKNSTLIFSLMICWLICQLYLNNYYFSSGYEVIGGDHKRFLVLANYLISIINFFDYEKYKFDEFFFQLDNFTLKHFNYIGYGFIITLFKLLFKSDLLSLKIIIYFQIIVSLISGICLFFLIKKYSTIFIAFFTAFLYLCYPPLQSWNLFILSDSLALSFTIIVISLFLIYDSKSLKIIFIFIFISLLVATIRPHAWILPLSLISYLVIVLKKDKFFLMFGIVTIILFLGIYYIIDKMLKAENNWHTSYNASSSFVEFIVWHEECIETDINFFKYKCIKMDEDTKNVFLLTTQDKGSLHSLGWLILNEPKHFSQVFFWRVFWELIKLRPTYSLSINLFFILTLGPIYFFSLIGIGIYFIKKIINPMVGLFAFIAFYDLLFIGFTFAGFSARFSLILYPFIFYFSIFGFKNCFNKVIFKEKN